MKSKLIRKIIWRQNYSSKSIGSMNKNFYCGVGDQSLPGCSFVQEDEGERVLARKREGVRNRNNLISACFRPVFICYGLISLMSKFIQSKVNGSLWGLRIVQSEWQRQVAVELCKCNFPMFWAPWRKFQSPLLYWGGSRKPGYIKP